MPDRLIIISAPDAASLRKASRLVRGDSCSWVYLGQNIVEKSRVPAVLGQNATFVDTTKRFHDAADKLRGPYLEENYRAGRKIGTLRWWITSISYRNGILSQTFHDTCLLKSGLDTVAEWVATRPLILVAQDTVRQALADNLRETPGIRLAVTKRFQLTLFRHFSNIAKLALYRVFFVARESRRIFLARRNLPDIPQLTGPIALVLGWATPHNIHLRSEFHSSFFGPLAGKLGKLGYSVAVAPIIVRELRYKEALQKLQGGSRSMLVPHRYLGYLDVFRAAFSTLSPPPKPPFADQFCGMDIRSITNEEMRIHWISNAAADTMLMLPVMRRWASLGFDIKRIIFIYENQPMERAVCWEARRLFPEAQIIAYQHARVPRMLLNFHLAAEGETEAPLPDRIVTVGKLTARLMCDNGHRPDRIRVGGALHMESVLSLKPATPSPGTNHRQPMVLVASSDSLMETAELAYMAARLFTEEQGILVVIKCHPRMPFQKVANLIGTDLPSHVRVSEEPIIDLISESSVMVYSGSTVAVHALALQVPSVHLETQYDFDMDPLETVANLRLSAAGLEDLRAKVTWLLENREAYIAAHKHEWECMVKDMYEPVTEDTIHAFVD